MLNQYQYQCLPGLIIIIIILAFFIDVKVNCLSSTPIMSFNATLTYATNSHVII